MGEPRIDPGAALRRLRHAVATTGIRRALSDVLTLLVAYHPERDTSFDRAFSTDTGARLPPAQLDIADPHARDAAIVYLPSPARVTRWAIESLTVDYRRYAFVDLGCGKGRVLLVASEFPFERIVGVEISPTLAAIARDNIARYTPSTRRCRSVEVQQADAARFDFPDTDLVIHLYHPFESPVLDAVLRQLERSLQVKPRRVVLAYLLYAAAAGPVAEVFARFPWLRQVRHERSLLGHYDWLFYSN